MYYLSSIIFSALIITIISINPVAFFHGMGDNCERNAQLMKYIANKLSFSVGTNNGIYVKCFETGASSDSILTSMSAQSESACNQIKNDTNFNGNFSIIGFSQGNLISRYIIEKCDMKGTVTKYISVGGPHLGVGKFPFCWSGAICHFINRVISYLVYSESVQQSIGPAGYYRVPDYESIYLSSNKFLPDLNNELENKTESYKTRFSQLEKLILIKFELDHMIYPREGAWFQFVNDKEELVKLEDSNFYKKDFIGLKKLMDEQKVTFLSINEEHCQMEYSDFDTYVIPYLK